MRATEPRNVDVLAGPMALRELVRTQFGPNGSVKLLLTDDGPVVASDLHRLLDSLEITHPTARMVAVGAVQQKETVGDGSLAVVVLAGALARNAQELLDQGFHRATIARGYEHARRVATDELAGRGTSVEGLDDPRARAVLRSVFPDDLPDLTQMTDVAARAATLVDERRRGSNRGIDLRDVTFRRVPTEGESGAELFRGVVLDREPVTQTTPTDVPDARIAVVGGGKKAGTGIEERSLRREGGSQGSGRLEVTFSASSPDDVATFREHEQADVRSQVATLSEAGVDVVFTTMGISDAAVGALEDAGITAFRNLMEDQAAELARSTGATVVNHLEDIRPDDVGTGSVRVVGGDQSYVRVEGRGDGVASLLISGALGEQTTAVERDLTTAIVTAIDLLEGERVVAGGGGIETRLADVVRSAAVGIPDRSSLVMDAYADALEDVPATLARNAGVDAVDVLPRLRAGGDAVGFDSRTGAVRSVVPDGPLVTTRVVRTAVETATDVAVHLVRIDDVLDATDGSDPITDFDLTPDPGRD